MICKNYDQLTIVEKTQFVGKLMHLVQTSDHAFLSAEQLIKTADSQGVFNKIVILPVKERTPVPDFYEEDVMEENSSYNYQAGHTMFIPSHPHNLVFDVYSKTKDTIQRSYQKLFGRLAS